MNKMWYVFSILVMFTMAGCRNSEFKQADLFCTVSKTGSIATVTCPDGTSTTITDGSKGDKGDQGNTGTTGSTGIAGATGPTGAAGTNGTSGISGTNGTSGVNGANGTNGTSGVSGTNGTNGHSAAFSMASADSSICPNGGSVIKMGVDLNNDGILQTSEVTQAAVLCNGLNGADSSPSVFMPVTAITPCGPTSSLYKEVLLGMFGGAILSEFTGGSNTNQIRNILVPDGSYYDTDSSQCNFTVSSSSNNRSVIWNGSSNNGSGPYHAGSATFNYLTNSWSTSY